MVSRHFGKPGNRKRSRVEDNPFGDDADGDDADGDDADGDHADGDHADGNGDASTMTLCASDGGSDGQVLGGPRDTIAIVPPFDSTVQSLGCPGGIVSLAKNPLDNLINAPGTCQRAQMEYTTRNKSAFLVSRIPNYNPRPPPIS